MGAEAVKIFLNQEIRGDEVRAKDERLFCGAAKIRPPRYDSRYLETFPTVWAAAHEFHRLIEQSFDKNADGAVLKTANEAVEEWVCLFLLHYCGVINPYVYTKGEDDENDDFSKYDHDLWTALSLTYPSGGLRSVTLLRADDNEEIGDGTVVGGYYPGVFFFPSRGRAAWSASETLRPYLENNRLSWERCRKSALLKEDHDRAEFSAHLARVEQKLGPLKQALTNFRNREIAGGHLPSVPAAYPLSDGLLGWKRRVVEDASQLMERYPLVRISDDGKQITYFLVSDMPGEQDEWMSEPIGPGMPTPRSFSCDVDNANIVNIKHAGKTIRYELKSTTEIVEKAINLRDCFLTVNPFWCAIPGGAFSAKIRDFHRVSTSREGPFSSLKAGETAVCLAPVKSKFLQDFSFKKNLLIDVKVQIQERQDEEGNHGLDWFFELQSRDGVKRVRWPTMVEQRSDLSNNAVALWPPKTSKSWHFYVARCFGSSKSKSGTWVLVDENGRFDPRKVFALDVNLRSGSADVTEYVSQAPLSESSEQPNRPEFLMLLDTDDKMERGVLVLDNIDDVPDDEVRSARLGIDFGTSNTCFAYKVDTNEPKALLFNLAPIMLWGIQPQAEEPGRVPFNWQGKQFFPTVLLSRKNADLQNIQPNNIEIGQLFQIDIPSLHRNMEDLVYLGKLGEWLTHTNLKWQLKAEHNSYRTLFLALSLLYAHAQIFFADDAGGVRISDYIFSFPLAFTAADESRFCTDAKAIAKTIRRLCYGENGAAYYKLDESAAIAASAAVPEDSATLQVFIDIGGGTTDIAIRNGTNFASLDSIRVAGRTFFSFARHSFEADLKGAKEFRTNLSRLLEKREAELSLQDVKVDLGTFYSLKVARLETGDFRDRESIVLQKGMGSNSYQRYRTLVFFRQLIAYALLQASAAAVTVDSEIEKIEMILAGNAWALMLFGGLARSANELKKEVTRIFKLLRKRFADALKAENEDAKSQRLEALQTLSVELLNERDLNKAKTAVAIGAVKAHSQGEVKEIADRNDDSIAGTDRAGRDVPAFAGLNLSEAKVNDFAVPLRWYDVWDSNHFASLVETLYGKDLGEIRSFSAGRAKVGNTPFDESLSIFSRLGNLGSYDDDESLGEEAWQRINALLHQDKIYFKSSSGLLSRSPISYFISEILYPEDSDHEYLKSLARINNCL